MRLIDADKLIGDIQKKLAIKDIEYLTEQEMSIVKMIINAPTENEWIPVSYHEITEEEREENGYPKDWVYLLDCEMPQDEQEILVQVKNGEIRWDVCYPDDRFSLDSGWDWADDVVAWMPLPEPYTGADMRGKDSE